MSKTDQSQRALAREWLWARVTVVAGFVIALAFVAYVVYSARVRVANQETALQTAQQTAVEAHARANAAASLQLCSMALSASKNFGIVPAYGKLLSTKVQKTDVQGRYVCLAATSVTKYLLAADLLCRDLHDQRCVSLYSITQDDGTVLYQRRS